MKKTKKELKEFASELKALLEKHQMNLWVEMEGDTYGVSIEGFMAVDESGNAYNLHRGMSCIDHYDLAQYIKEL